MDKIFDVAIIGGGINGCGCAADAALRGLSVVLLEQDDLSSKTSSSSTKLIHGGLRYLEHYEFKLVKKSLEERQTLLKLAPHLVHPQAFVLPYQKHMRPAWLLRLGLFFYDHLSRKNHLPKCKTVYRAKKNKYFTPLIDSLKRGFLFYDAATDDARLTVVNAIQARDYGASIRPYSKVIKTAVKNNLWELTIEPALGPNYCILAKTIINASGPWVEKVAELTSTSIEHKITLAQGSHIVIPKLYEGNHAYLLQHADQRAIFIIPFHGFTLVGTTDLLFSKPPQVVHISQAEIDYLCEFVNSYFKTQIKKNDIIHTWSGIRPLLTSDEKETKLLSRDYRIQVESLPAPIVTVFGGKITTYRKLAETVINQLSAFFPQMASSKTKKIPLPGGNIESMSFKKYISFAKNKYSWLDTELLNRYLYSYGCRTELFLSTCTDINSMGIYFGTSLYQIEVDYLIREEWAKTVDDILLRRTKLGLTMDDTGKNSLKNYLSSLSHISDTSISNDCWASSLNVDSEMLPTSE